MPFATLHTKVRDRSEHFDERTGMCYHQAPPTERVVMHVTDAAHAKPHLEDTPLSLLGACYATPSTTVVLMKLRAVCSANTWRSLDARGAMWTRPESVRRAAAWPARDARRDDVSHEHSAAHQPARGLEGRQTAPPGALRDFF